jgi:cation:H+ antiporter
MNIFFSFIVLLSSLVILGFSSDKTIQYLVYIANIFNLSNVFIGFVLLSIATGIPELLIAIQSLIIGKPMVSAGDILGSNFSDVSVCLGLTAGLFGPIYIEFEDKYKHLIVLLLNSALMAFVFLIGYISRPLGFILILIYVACIVIFWEFERKELRQIYKERKEEEIIPLQLTTVQLVIRLIFFITIVIISSKVCVLSAVNLATNLNIPPGVISAVIIGIGTSLPELSLNIQAVRTKRYAIAIGNSLGSVLEQGSLILGILSLGLEKPLSLKFLVHIVPFMFFSYAMIGYCLIFKRKMTRLYGFILLGTYVAYILYEVWYFWG